VYDVVSLEAGGREYYYSLNNYRYTSQEDYYSYIVAAASTPRPSRGGTQNVPSNMRACCVAQNTSKEKRTNFLRNYRWSDKTSILVVWWEPTGREFERERYQ
jgi:hypothetical protein